MRIHNPKRFGMHITLKRKEAGLHPRAVAQAVGIDQRMLFAIEQGQVGGPDGADIDDELLEALTDAIPGLSLATSPGVTGRPLTKAELEDGGIQVPTSPPGPARR